MKQSAFELELLRQLVTFEGKNEIGSPQLRVLDYLFYDKLDSFDGITKSEYTEYVISMIARGLLTHDTHGYDKNCYERWSIRVTATGISKLQLTENGEVQSLKP